MQAKDIPTPSILHEINAIADLQDGSWVMRWALEPLYPQVPERLLLAKLRQLIKNGLIDGCACGCRGDLELTDKGYAFLEANPVDVVLPSPLVENIRQHGYYHIA
jgi:hypothetical protein